MKVFVGNENQKYNKEFVELCSKIGVKKTATIDLLKENGFVSIDDEILVYKKNLDKNVIFSIDIYNGKKLIIDDISLRKDFSMQNCTENYLNLIKECLNELMKNGCLKKTKQKNLQRLNDFCFCS